jgi:hypothetical protein
LNNSNVGKVIGSILIGGNEFTIIEEQLTHCIYKTSIHPPSSFNINEYVELLGTAVNEMKVVNKPNLPSKVYAFSDCIDNIVDIPNELEEFDRRFQISRHNIGEWHNKLIKAIYSNIENLNYSGQDLYNYLYSSRFIVNQFKSFCNNNSINPPSDSVLF